MVVEQALPPQRSTDESKRVRKLERALVRAEERLVDYERLVDRTQHLLNTRIGELEAARAKLHAQQRELTESEQRFRQLTEAAFEAILVHDAGRIVDCNDAATTLYLMDKEQLLGTELLQLVRPCWQEQAGRTLSQSSAQPHEQTHVRADGTQVPVEVRSREILYHGRPAIVTAIRDITEHKTLQEKLERLAGTDPLTGIDNRRNFMESGQREYFRSLRYGQPLSVLMIDADHFKRINDTYGHDIGDQTLCRLAQTCVGSLRANDIVGRLGGEEFAALLPLTDGDGARELAQRLRSRIAEVRISSPKGLFSITVSIGVASLAAEDQSLEQLLNRADRALYKAKDNGRDRVETA